MKKIFMTMAVLALTSAGQAASLGQTLGVTSLSPVLSSVSTVCGASIEDCRQLAEAKDDAAEFLATNGEVRSAKLQNAFNTLRSVDASLRASDLELAEGILAL